MVATTRAATAYHEAAHAVIAVALGIRLRAVSLRPGATFGAATFLGPTRRRSRWAREDDIVVTLAGDLAYLVGGPLLTGWVEPSDEEEAARTAVAELARVPRSALRIMLAAEARPEGRSDADSAWDRLSSMDGNDVQLIGAHLAYLTARAAAIIRAHPRAVWALAERLYLDTVVSGAEAERIVKWFLCLCHVDRPGWGDGQRGRAPARRRPGGGHGGRDTARAARAAGSPWHNLSKLEMTPSSVPCRPFSTRLSEAVAVPYADLMRLSGYRVPGRGDREVQRHGQRGVVRRAHRRRTRRTARVPRLVSRPTTLGPGAKCTS